MDMKLRTEKTLWEKYGKMVLTLTLIVVIAFGCSEYYKHQEAKEALAASKTYGNLITALQKQDKEEITVLATRLTEEYGRTPYASLAALTLAKLALEENNLEAAKKQLRFASLGNERGPIQQVARVRLARVMATEKKYEEALAVLSKPSAPEGFVTLFEEAKGDIYLLQNDKNKANEAYQMAIKAAPEGVPLVRLQLKQAELGFKPDVSVKEGS